MAVKTREPTFIAAVGMTGVGKTYENLIQIRSVLIGNIPKGVMPRKVLILDNNVEYNNDNNDVREILGKYRFYIKTLHYNQVPDFSKQQAIECARVVPIDNKGKILSGKEFGETLNFVLQNFKGGLIVGEDFKAFTGNSLNEQLIGQLSTRRHSGCDTLVSLQGINMIQPTLLMVLKWIRLHKSLDPIDRADKFKGKIQLLSIAQNIVDNRYKHGGEHERFFVKVELQRSIIYGNYTRDEFNYAAKQYIFENYSATVGKKKAWRDDKGKSMYNDATAILEVLNEYSNQFSQYSPRYQE